MMGGAGSCDEESPRDPEGPQEDRWSGGHRTRGRGGPRRDETWVHQGRLGSDLDVISLTSVDSCRSP